MEGIKFIANSFSNIWNYTLITVDQNPIKIANIVLAFAMIMIALKYYEKFSKYVKHYVKKNFNPDRDTANSIEKGIIYFLYSIYLVVVIQIANIPISAFAFIGGALALGVGLGAQNLLNNLISGFIIMAEKPIRIGDIVEVGGVLGSVTAINARCVIINTFDNIDILIPNSSLLQENVTNWTYTDTIIRSRVNIKVPHKTNHNIVLEIINSVLTNNQHVLKNPEPSILLLEITENGALYEINYFSDFKSIPSLKQVKSAINLELARQFHDHNIDFATQSHYVKVIQ